MFGEESIFAAAEAKYGVFDMQTHNAFKKAAQRKLSVVWSVWGACLITTLTGLGVLAAQAQSNRPPSLTFAWLKTFDELSSARMPTEITRLPESEVALLGSRLASLKDNSTQEASSKPPSRSVPSLGKPANLTLIEQKSSVEPPRNLIRQPNAPSAPVITALKTDSEIVKPTTGNKPQDFARASEYGLKTLMADGVVRVNGVKIAIGGTFPNGEKILSVTPELGIIETDRRILNVID